MDFPGDESERRRRVAQEKIWGSIIENIERSRRKPIAHSILLRLYFLHQHLTDYSTRSRSVIGGIDPLKTQAPPFTVQQVNFLIRTYNDIINDIYKHFRKKDSYVNEFSPFEELDKPTINDVYKTLYMIESESLQIMSYMFRWTG